LSRAKESARAARPASGAPQQCWTRLKGPRTDLISYLLCQALTAVQSCFGAAWWETGLGTLQITPPAKTPFETASCNSRLPHIGAPLAGPTPSCCAVGQSRTRRAWRNAWHLKVAGKNRWPHTTHRKSLSSVIGVSFAATAAFGRAGSERAQSAFLLLHGCRRR
jgi:hypothetical protein